METIDLMNALGYIAQATGEEPAGGAAIGEAIGATAGALVATALIAVLVAGHRSGRLTALARLGSFAERHTGLPAWASVPSLLMGVSLLTAVLGMYWDISLHIDNGRDAGPLANPAHYLILIGLYGVLVAGVFSIALAGRERPTKTAVHLGGDWWAPVGGLMMAACGAFALTGFPLDDMWHRLFGQDVTLWGPTHLMLIGGASLATLGGMVLMGEAITSLGSNPERGETPWVYNLRRALLVGGFLVALSTFQAEFDFGVPQFRAVFQPILIMLAAGVGLVATRLYCGRGGALLAVGGYIAIRGFLAITVGGVFGQTLPHFPLYHRRGAARGGGVRACGRPQPGRERGDRRRPDRHRRARRRVGVVARLDADPLERLAAPRGGHGRPPHRRRGGAVGGFIGASITGRSGVLLSREDGRRLARPDRLAALGAGLVLIAVIGWALPMSEAGPERAQVALRDIDRGSERTVAATIRIEPRDALDDPEFMNVTGWQGGGSVLDPLEEVAPGVYRTTEPIPVYGGWKSTLRVQQGDGLISLPLFMPRDEAIPAKEVPAAASFTRDFLPDVEVLQRERKQDVSGALTLAAYLTVLAIALALIALIAWSLVRVDRGGGRPPRASRTGRPRAELV